MDVNKNSYTFIFAAIMVVVVAAVLSFAATNLKPYQDENVRQEKMQNILSSIGVDVSRAEASELYSNYIVEELVISNGEVKEGVNAFNIELVKEIRKAPEEREAPLYIANKDGETYFIIPLQGKGLWGPIWGYVALQKDVNTVYGAVFDHKGETPGLGAEIKTPIFMDQFEGKKIRNENGEFVSIAVRKGDASGDNQVDGISGGTITSVGVEEMLKDSITPYLSFLESYEGTESESSL